MTASVEPDPKRHTNLWDREERAAYYAGHCSGTIARGTRPGRHHVVVRADLLDAALLLWLVRRGMGTSVEGALRSQGARQGGIPGGAMTGPAYEAILAVLDQWREFPTMSNSALAVLIQEAVHWRAEDGAEARHDSGSTRKPEKESPHGDE